MMKVPKDADVIIIGSGMGGMGAASILSKYGESELYSMPSADLEG